MWTKWRSKAGCWLVVISIMAIPVTVTGIENRKINILLTNDLAKKHPIQEFDCNEKIYLVGIVDGLEGKHHIAEIFWINPHGKKQDYALQNLSGGSRQTIWFWLKLHPGFGGRLLSKIDPSAGMEEFIGQWTVKFYIDKKLVDTKPFFVAC